MFTEVTAAVLGAGVSQLFGYGIWKHRRKKQDIDTWYEESLDSLSRGHGICQSARQRSNLNYGSVTEESKRVSKRLNSQLSNIPEGVDPTSVDMVKELEEVFRKMSAVTEAAEEQTTTESLSEIFEMGQREFSGKEDADMGSAVDESLNYSTSMAALFEQADMDPRLFGNQFGNEFEDADSMEELTKSMSSQFGASKKMFEKAIESEFISDDWDDGLSLGIRVQLQTATALCEDAINHLSEQANKQSAT